MFWYVIGLIVGFAAGVAITLLITTRRITAGTLEIDKWNPEKDTYRITIDDLDMLEKKKYVELKVMVATDPSQK